MASQAIKALVEDHCHDLAPGEGAVDSEHLSTYLHDLPGWSLTANSITKTWKFADFAQTMAFINLIAFVAHRENHHPDVRFGYNTATVTYSTHSTGGVSINDFICAAKIEAMIAAA